MDPGKAYPVDYDGTVKVSAFGKYGHRRQGSQDEVDILVPLEDISADGPVYMTSFASEFVTGSSVATALAAGIASLAFMMIQVANRDLPDLRESLKRSKIMQVFAKMSGGHNGIQLSKLFADGFDINKEPLEDVWAASNFREPERKVNV